MSDDELSAILAGGAEGIRLHREADLLLATICAEYLVNVAVSVVMASGLRTTLKTRRARSRADGYAAIERGELFTALRERHGAAEITEVTRQRVDWQRQAARDLAEGRFAEPVGAFDKTGAITWTNTQEAARKALVDAWTRDGAAHPGKTQFVFAYTNRDVNALNAELREVRRARGELAGADVALETKHGRAAFAIGDRVQFT